MASNIEDFRHIVRLPGGLQVLLRTLRAEDRDLLIEFFGCASDTDLQFFRNDVRDTSLVARWAEQVDLTRVIPIVAIVQDRIVGEATLHLGRGYSRHVAEARVYLCGEFRRRGVGSALLKALVDIARDLDLHQVFTQIAASQTQVIRAFQAVGFKVEHMFEDRFMDPAGDTQGLVEVVLYLKRLGTL